MKRIGLILVGLCLSSLVFGQSELVTLSAGGGLHSLKHEPKLPTKNELGKCFGEGKLSAGATFSARYMHFFRDRNWGIGTGADVSYYTATSCLDGVETTSEYDTYNKEKFDCSFAYMGWEERQRVLALEIPLDSTSVRISPTNWAWWPVWVRNSLCRSTLASRSRRVLMRFPAIIQAIM